MTQILLLLNPRDYLIVDVNLVCITMDTSVGFTQSNLSFLLSTFKMLTITESLWLAQCFLSHIWNCHVNALDMSKREMRMLKLGICCVILHCLLLMAHWRCSQTPGPVCVYIFMQQYLCFSDGIWQIMNAYPVFRDYFYHLYTLYT